MAHERTGAPEANRLEAAVAAGVLASEQDFGRLLRSIVEVARAIFRAKASSVFLFDDETDELVFAAVAGDAEQSLVGKRMPSSTGIAGWVLSSRTPLVLEDVQNDPRFARAFAEQTGYVPQGLMAVPLLDDERVLGVLQVLDRPAAVAVLAAGDGAARALRRARRRSRSTLLGSARTARAALEGSATCRRSRGWRRRSSDSKESGAAPGSRCCARSNSCSPEPPIRGRSEGLVSEALSRTGSAGTCYASLPPFTCASTSSLASSAASGASAVA